MGGAEVLVLLEQIIDASSDDEITALMQINREILEVTQITNYHLSELHDSLILIRQGVGLILVTIVFVLVVRFLWKIFGHWIFGSL